MPSSVPGPTRTNRGEAAPGRPADASIERPDILDNATLNGLAVNLLIAVIACASLWPVSDPDVLLAWFTFTLAALGIRWVLHRGSIAIVEDRASQRYWRLLVVASSAVIGVGWGWLGFFLFPAGGGGYQILWVTAVAAAVATAPAVAPFSEAAAAFLLPAVVPTVARLSLLGGTVSGAIGALLCVLMCYVWWSLLRYRRELSQRVRLHLHKERSDIERTTYVRSVETANRLFAQVVIEREQAEADLQVAKQAAEEANRVKGEFLAYTSHEIRTPLNAIIGLTRAVMESPLSSEQRDYLRRVRNAGDRLLALINDLLDMSKIEAGKLEIERVGFNLREVLDEVVEEQAVKASEQGLALKLDVARDVPDNLIGDPLRLRQVLLNLLGNAIKFTNKGTVTVRVVLLQRDRDSACSLRFAVIDTGIGISPEKQATLFQRYTQAETSTSRKFGGTGLGLSISKSLVELMSGSIGLRSAVDQGTEFYFDLPFAIQAASAVPIAAVAKARESAPGRTLKVLVAEDNEDNQLLIELLLRKRGADITIVGNGMEALQQLNQSRFDLVLMDLEMPTMGGFEAVAELRRREDGAGLRTPVIALSAHALVGHREKCLEAGMDDYLTKPVDPDLLYAAMDAYAGNGPARERASAGGSG